MIKQLILILIITVVPVLKAEGNSKDFGHFRVFYSVLNSDFIQPEVAKQYGLTRSKVVGLVNITVIDKTTEKATVANISGNAINLIGQNKTLAFKEIREANALYYIAQFNFDNNERYNFKLNIRTPGEDTTHPVNFTHTMYISQ